MPPGQLPPPDYATAAYDDAWDFDEGDTEGIDRFGDRDEFWSDIRVEDGALRATVRDDPYIVWGTMWGPEDQGERRVRIDVDRYNQLSMRVRQSVPSASWALFGRRAGAEDLMRYQFTVTGQGWQTVRVDLLEEAGWGGEISSFRIDTTEDVEADIAIDWVRLLSVTPAGREAVEARGEHRRRRRQLCRMFRRLGYRRRIGQTVRSDGRAGGNECGRREREGWQDSHRRLRAARSGEHRCCVIFVNAPPPAAVQWRRP